MIALKGPRLTDLAFSHCSERLDQLVPLVLCQALITDAFGLIDQLRDLWVFCAFAFIFQSLLFPGLPLFLLCLLIGGFCMARRLRLLTVYAVRRSILHFYISTFVIWTFLWRNQTGAGWVQEVHGQLHHLRHCLLQLTMLSRQRGECLR